jgi:hypothetical protein
MPSRYRKGQPDADLERGIPRRTVVGRNPDVTAQCPTPGCGEQDAGAIAAMAGLPRPRIPDGWIYVLVRSSAVPARWFCSAPCAAVGIALAQLKLAVPPPKK